MCKFKIERRGKRGRARRRGGTYRRGYMRIKGRERKEEKGKTDI